MPSHPKLSLYPLLLLGTVFCLDKDIEHGPARSIKMHITTGPEGQESVTVSLQVRADSATGVDAEMVELQGGGSSSSLPSSSVVSSEDETSDDVEEVDMDQVGGGPPLRRPPDPPPP